MMSISHPRFASSIFFAPLVHLFSAFCKFCSCAIDPGEPVGCSRRDSNCCSNCCCRSRRISSRMRAMVRRAACNVASGALKPSLWSNGVCAADPRPSRECSIPPNVLSSASAELGGLGMSLSSDSDSRASSSSQNRTRWDLRLDCTVAAGWWGFR